MHRIAELKHDLLVLDPLSGGGEDPQEFLFGPCKGQFSINLRYERVSALSEGLNLNLPFYSQYREQDFYHSARNL